MSDSSIHRARGPAADPGQTDQPCLGSDHQRSIGVEIEFGALEAAEAARAVQAAVGGRIHTQEAHSFEVRATVIGDVKVALDLRLAHPGREPDTLLGAAEAKLRALLGNVGRHLLPNEVTTAPLGVEDLPHCDRIIMELKERGARGTRSAPFYAFGLHLNPQPPDLYAPTILGVMKAFALGNGWLRARVHPDETRRALRWAQPWPDAYVRQLVAPDYWPDQTKMIDDYLAATTNRNHDLDLLPLFAHLDRERVEQAVTDKLVRARPTFHYRLPNADLENAGWSVVGEWAWWRAVERLAADRVGLDRLGRLYLDRAARTRHLPPPGWAQIIGKELAA